MFFRKKKYSKKSYKKNYYKNRYKGKKKSSSSLGVLISLPFKIIGFAFVCLFKILEIIFSSLDNSNESRYCKTNKKDEPSVIEDLFNTVGKILFFPFVLFGKIIFAVLGANAKESKTEKQYREFNEWQECQRRSQSGWR